MDDKPFHIELLQNEIQKRKLSNPRYSLRAFSRYLGMGPSTLSRILSTNQDLSLSASKKIIKKLRLSPDDRRLFITSIAEEKKQRALSTLSSSQEADDVEYLSSYEEMLKSSRDLIFILDSSCRCLYANETASHYLEIPSHQLIGKTPSQLGAHEVIGQKIEPLVKEVWETGTLVIAEGNYRGQNDSLVYEILLLPILGDEDQVSAVVCHWRDITERQMMDNYLNLMVEAGQILMESVDYKKSLPKMLKLLTQDLCQASLLKLKVKDELMREGDEVLIRELLELFPLDHSNPSYLEIQKEQQPKLFSHLDEASVIFQNRQGQLGSVVCVPIKCRVEYFGELFLIRSWDHPSFTAREMDLAQDIGVRAAEAVDYSILFEKCHD